MNKKLEEAIKILIEENTTWKKEKAIKTLRNYIENSIPNDKVATKIKTLVMEEEYDYIDNRKTIRELQELLEKK